MDDLALFPDLTDELRDVRVTDLVPRGYGPGARVLNVFDSGGTTGAPKRVVQLEDWMRHSSEQVDRRLRAHGLPVGAHWLTVTPTGPHLVGDVLQRAAAGLGAPGLSIDMDPRWVRGLVTAGRADEAEAYTDHLVEQFRRILLTQDIGVLAATTPLLERFAREDDLVEAINSKVDAIVWGGTHMDPDTRDLLSTQVFPDVRLIGMYGNTMMLTALIERVGLSASDLVSSTRSRRMSSCRSWTRSPGRRWRSASGGRSWSAMSASRCSSPTTPSGTSRCGSGRSRGHAGDAVADVAPVPKVGGEAVIEGVY